MDAPQNGTLGLRGQSGFLPALKKRRESHDETDAVAAGEPNVWPLTTVDHDPELVRQDLVQVHPTRPPHCKVRPHTPSLVIRDPQCLFRHD
jgi:hypothetical protein